MRIHAHTPDEILDQWKQLLHILPDDPAQSFPIQGGGLSTQLSKQAFFIQRQEFLCGTALHQLLHQCSLGIRRVLIAYGQGYQKLMHGIRFRRGMGRKHRRDRQQHEKQRKAQQDCNHASDKIPSFFQ